MNKQVGKEVLAPKEACSDGFTFPLKRFSDACYGLAPDLLLGDPMALGLRLRLLRRVADENLPIDVRWALLPVVQNGQECPFYGKNPLAGRLRCGAEAV